LDPLNRASDAELVRLIQGNRTAPTVRREAFGLLYDRNQARIFRYLWMRLNDRKQAEDLTGEVFTRMLAALPKYQDRELPFQAWLYRIAHNLLIDHYRNKGSNPGVPLDEVKDMLMTENDPVKSVEDKLTVQEVQRALERLDPAQKSVIVLRFLVGLPIKEVALILNRTIPAVKALQYRGLQEMRAALREG